MLIDNVKRQHYSAFDFETTTRADKLDIRIWTITFRPSVKYTKRGDHDKALESWFKDGALVM